MKTFAPRIYFRNMWIFYIAGLLFLSTALFVRSGWSGHSRTIVLLFCVVWFSFLIIRSFVPGTSYIIGTDKLVFKSLWFWKHPILFEDIVDIRKISKTELQTFLEHSWIQGIITKAAQIGGRYIPSPQEIARELNSRMKYNWLIGYCSVPIVTNVSQRGVKSSTEGDFIPITLTNGRQHLISPKDVDGFLAEIKRYDQRLIY